LLNINDRLITSLGWVAMLLTTVIYWAAALVVWLRA